MIDAIDRVLRPERSFQLGCLKSSWPWSRTQGKIERWHHVVCDRILPENFYLLGSLAAPTDALGTHSNNQRYPESLDYPAPADVYFGHEQTIFLKRLKNQTQEHRTSALPKLTKRRLEQQT